MLWEHALTTPCAALCHPRPTSTHGAHEPYPGLCRRSYSGPGAPWICA